MALRNSLGMALSYFNSFFVMAVAVVMVSVVGFGREWAES